jgi:hypothetical protein
MITATKENWLQYVKRMDRARIENKCFDVPPLEDDCQGDRRKDGW